MQPEPEYLAQHGDFGSLSVEERRAWVKRCADKARAQGITFFRVSVDDADNPTMALVEGWEEQPDDQGEPRWQMVEAPDAE